MTDKRPLRIDLGSPIPAYRQLADSIRTWLVAGDLAAGSMLPPVRRLAVDLGVHHNTVARAYRELADEGWLDLTRGRGASVLDRPSPAASAEHTRRLRTDLDTLIARGRAEGIDSPSLAAMLRQVANSLCEEQDP